MAYSLLHEDGQAAYLALNGHEHAIDAALPLPPPGCEWRRLVDTAWDAPDDALLDERGAVIESQVRWGLEFLAVADATLANVSL